MANHSGLLAQRIPWQRSLVGYRPWGREESDTTEWLTHTRLENMPRVPAVCRTELWAFGIQEWAKYPEISPTLWRFCSRESQSGRWDNESLWEGERRWTVRGSRRFPGGGGSVVKNPSVNEGDTGLTPDQEDPTCHRAAKPTCHNYWACAPEPGSHNYWAHVPQLLKSECPEACAPRQEKTLHWEACAL